MDLPLAAGLALGDARLALVEQLQRPLHGLAHLALGRGRNAVACLKGGIDGGFESGQRHRGYPWVFLRGGRRFSGFEGRSQGFRRPGEGWDPTAESINFRAAIDDVLRQTAPWGYGPRPSLGRRESSSKNPVKSSVT